MKKRIANTSLENPELVEALHWLGQADRFGKKIGLDNIRTLLETLGNPHKDLKAVHVAGTNGKGSTCAMIASILMEAGYRVGLYTSPHLVSPRERIRVNGEWISERHFVRGIQLLRQKVMSVKGKGTFSPTYFELMTALALYHFSEIQVDYVVLETGMGGRLDSTNIVDSKVQVITNIDLEHTRYLGKTVQEIAREKGGIIKPLSPVITGATGVALEVIEKYALKQGAHLIRLNQELQYELRNQSLEGQSVVISTHKGNYSVFLKLLGLHQVENSALAIGAIESLERLEIHIGKNIILRGLEKARWPGRFEILRQKPLVILDAAHNPRAAQVLVETWHDYFGKQKTQIIFSALEDKDIHSMAKTLSKIAENVILIELSHRRGLKLGELQDVWGSYLPKKRVRVSSPEQAFHLIQEGDTAEGPILITGSIYLLGEILREVNPLRGLELVRQQSKIQ